MCGFAALFQPGRTFEPDLLAGIDLDLQHRGPDSGGIRSWSGAALVFRRLSIIDTSAISDQPMSSADGRHTLVFNGEIYNYKNLRRELQSAGFRLRTNGDTEVLLEGYRHWGQEIVDRLEGMFAFVILDHENGTVFAARDPYGIKPLYLLRRGDLIGLASEMRPFARLVPPEPDPEALAELLVYGWAAGSLSNLRNVERVPGGTALEFSLSGGPVRRRRFLDPLDLIQPDEGMTEEQALEIATAAVEASMKSHLMSDVGYAIELSGGVDSSLVAALATRDAEQPVASFSIDLGAYEHNEKSWRDLVVKRYPLVHHEVAMDGVDFANSLPRAIRHIEGPSRHAGCVFIMRLCDQLREHSKVVLTGEGADELFGGYSRYADWRKTALTERLSRLLPSRMWPDRWPFAGMRRVAGRDAAVESSNVFDTAPTMLAFPALVPSDGARGEASRRFKNFAERLFAVDQTAYLESLLMRQDKVSMAASVEARVPFTHLPLSRAVNRIPARLRVPGGETKPILKSIAERHLPATLVRRRKIGLRLPYVDWLREEDKLGRYVDLLLEPNARVSAFANRRELVTAIEGLRAGRKSLGGPVFRWVNVELWLRGLQEKMPVAPATSWPTTD